MRHLSRGFVFGLGLLAFGAVHARADSVRPAEVSEVKLGYGWRLVDAASGMTLYLYDSDERGSAKSNCNAGCAKLWPPMLAPADHPQVGGEWSVITREDGSRQWAFKGKPLYHYARDTYSGGTFGDGNGWSVAIKPMPMPPGLKVGKTLLGQVLTNAKGFTLYARADASRGGRDRCDAACLEFWSPVEAPWLATTVGDFSAIAREDGIAQWAYQGKPLYSYAKDAKSGDVNGRSVDKVWQAVVLEAEPPRPAWVTVVGSDGGELLADAKGMTIYAYDVDRNHLVYARGEDCFGACITESWTPVPAEAQVAPIGDWSVIKNDDGTLQWAYQGRPLFTSKVETTPGDLSGIMLRRARAWRPLMVSMPSI